MNPFLQSGLSWICICRLSVYAPALVRGRAWHNSAVPRFWCIHDCTHLKTISPVTRRPPHLVPFMISPTLPSNFKSVWHDTGHVGFQDHLFGNRRQTRGSVSGDASVHGRPVAFRRRCQDVICEEPSSWPWTSAASWPNPFGRYAERFGSFAVLPCMM